MAVPNPNPYPVGTPAAQLPPGSVLAPNATPVASVAPHASVAPVAPVAAPAPVVSPLSANLQLAMQIVASVLNDVNTLLTGKPVTVPLPAESFNLGNISVAIPSISIQVSYNAAGAAAPAAPAGVTPVAAPVPA